jgi:hypothetical protein
MDAIPWLAFRPDAAVPAYGIMESTGYEDSLGHYILTTQKYAAGDPRKLILVNGPSDVASGNVGCCSTALALPVEAKATGSIAAGASCGPTDADWTLTTGYPGFVAVAAAASGLVLIIRQPQVTVVRGQSTAAVNTSDGTFTIDNVESISGLSATSGSGGTLTIQNFVGLAAENNAITLAFWNEADTQWEGIVAIATNTC